MPKVLLPDCARLYFDPDIRGPIDHPSGSNRPLPLANDIGNPDGIPDTIIRVPMKYMEVVMKPEEQSAEFAVIRLRRLLTPELVRYRRKNGLKLP